MHGLVLMREATSPAEYGEIQEAFRIYLSKQSGLCGAVARVGVGAAGPAASSSLRRTLLQEASHGPPFSHETPTFCPKDCDEACGVILCCIRVPQLVRCVRRRSSRVRGDTSCSLSGMLARLPAPLIAINQQFSFQAGDSCLHSLNMN